MEKTINKKNIKPGDLVRIVLPEGTKIGDDVGGYTILKSMFNANNSIVKVQDVDGHNIRVEIGNSQDTGLYWFDKSCIQPLSKNDEPQFKVGDSVIITIPDSYKTSKVPFGIVPPMLALNGTYTRILGIIENDYDKEKFSHIENLDCCKYSLEGNTYYWPNCFLTKVASYGSDCDMDKEQSHIKQYPKMTPMYDTYTTMSNPIKEDKGLIKVKSKKLKLNFKN